MNDKIIQIGGKSYKKCDVVMLPTKEQRWKIGNEYVDRYECYSFVDKKLYSRQSNAHNWSLSHLYILSDEEIKEGDWVYHPEVSQEYTIVDIRKQGDDKYSKGMYPAQGVFQWKNTTNEWYKKCKKIIATTDESLRIYKEDIPCDKGYYTSLPRLSDDFLKAFVKAEGKITELLVETNAEFYADSEPFATKASRDSYVQETGASHSCWTKNLGLKVSPDNTITIKSVEEKTSWSREEVVALIQKLEKDGADYFGQAFLKQWIEENL